MLIYNLAGPGAVAPTYTTNQQFEANEWIADLAAGVGYTFINAGAPNIVALANPRLRVSDNGLFAVEDADLTRRQPKHFFATAAAIADWNKTLGRLGSAYQFFLDPPGTVTFTLPGAAAPTTLTRARPANLEMAVGRAGNAMTTTENCNGTITEVIGSNLAPTPRLGQPVFLGTGLAQAGFFDYHIANHLIHGLPIGNLPVAPGMLAPAQDVIAQRFGEDVRAHALGAPPPHNPNFGNDLQAVRVNRFAQPTAVGHGLYTASLGERHPAVPAGQQIQDYANNRLLVDAVSLNRIVWGAHWGGVVGIDGTDYLTLENYARNGENSFGNGAGLFYFQMYGANAGRSWHEQWETPFIRGKAFANGLTTVVQVNGPVGLHYFNAGSKNNHAAIGLAVSNVTLQPALLNGLNYANMHLYATSLADEFADRARRTAWRNAVAALLAAPPAWIDATTQSLANHVSAALAQVKAPPSL